MARFRIALHNSVGELDHIDIQSNSTGEDGLPFHTFVRALEAECDWLLADGDTLTVALVGG